MSRALKKRISSKEFVLLPGGDRIIVRPDGEGFDSGAWGDGAELIQKSDGHFYTRHGDLQVPASVEDAIKRRPLIGTVLSTGPMVEMEFTGLGGSLQRIFTGVKVLYGQFAGHPLERSVPGYEECVIMSEADVVCIVEEG